MPDFTMYLGDFGFQGFEVPPNISAGGEQCLAVHKYPGGIRTIDAMGADDTAISWVGIFDGPDSEDRCRQLDYMRRQGLPLPLVFATQSFAVVIRSFRWKFQRFWQIEYSIDLEVIQDDTQQPSDGDEPYDELMAEDLNAAVADAVFMADDAYNAALTVLRLQMALYNSLADLTGPVLIMLSALAAEATFAAGNVLGVIDVAFGGLPEVSASDPDIAAVLVTAFVADAVVMPYAFDAMNRGYRMQSLIEQAAV